jgi:hypothetical protein
VPPRGEMWALSVARQTAALHAERPGRSLGSGLSCASPAAARIARVGPPILTAMAAGFLWWESEGHGLDLLALVGCRGTVLEG